MCCQSTCWETCYDVWTCPDQKGDASDDKTFFRIETAASVRLAKNIHELPPVAYADSSTLVNHANDVNPGFHYYEAEGTALNTYEITGSAVSKIIQCLEPTKHKSGFDQDMTKEASEAEPPQEGERLSTIYEESEADLAAHIIEVRCKELREERGLLEATPLDDLYTVPTHMIIDNRALVAVAGAQRGHLPTWGHPRDSDIEETHHDPLWHTDEDHVYVLDSDDS
eukprot:9023806-Pyramimonas_sp.AAC.1